jgi:hypothetical protein
MSEQQIIEPATDRRPPSGRQATLGEATRFFAARATPRIIVPLLALAVVARVRLGAFGPRDLLLAGGLLALEPFTEWATHVYVLHSKPRAIGGRTFDLHAAQKHRHHHRHPNDPRTAFVPLVDLLFLGAIVAGIFGLVTWGDAGQFLTLTVTALAMLLTYEWTHYLIHTAYKPRHGYYRYIWRAHRLHHFKNEHYWMGVTVHLADHLLGTFPQKSEVENSPTARTLGIDVA